MDKIYAIVEVRLVYPYSLSLTTLIDFANLWNIKIYSCDSNSAYAKIKVPSSKFKKLCGSNPQIKEYKVPLGSEGFLSKFKVVKLEITKKEKYEQ